MVRRIPVSSSAVSAGYDAAARIVEVEFAGGGVYRYRRVPRRAFEGLLAADSVGTYVTTCIKPRYPYTRLG